MRDTEEVLYCPACNKKMQKVYIESANCNVDICVDGCGGILFDNRELEKFDEIHEDISEILKVYKDKNYEKTNEDKPRICPICSSVMVKNYTSASHQVQIDECYTCGAKFLDFNELELIREQFKTEKERINNFNKKFEQVHDISDFKSYQTKEVDDLLGPMGKLGKTIFETIFK